MDNIELIRQTLAKADKIIDDEVMRTLAYLGEDCVKRVRERPAKESWTDRTGNLRSSVGYAIAKESSVKKTSSFKQVQTDDPGTKNGSSQGQKFATESAQDTTAPYALVVVAGMEYAPYLEAKGYDVLAGAKLHAEATIDGYMQKTKDRINQKLEQL